MKESRLWLPEVGDRVRVGLPEYPDLDGRTGQIVAGLESCGTLWYEVAYDQPTVARPASRSGGLHLARELEPLTSGR